MKRLRSENFTSALTYRDVIGVIVSFIDDLATFYKLKYCCKDFMVWMMKMEHPRVVKIRKFLDEMDGWKNKKCIDIVESPCKMNFAKTIKYYINRMIAFFRKHNVFLRQTTNTFYNTYIRVKKHCGCSGEIYVCHFNGSIVNMHDAVCFMSISRGHLKNVFIGNAYVPDLASLFRFEIRDGNMVLRI
jgi:hypothetical protein